MKNINNIKRIFKYKITGNIVILISSLILIYFLISIYFINHFYFNTKINGVNVSLKTLEEANYKLSKEVEEYRLELIGRDGETEEIIGSDIELKYSNKNSVLEIKKNQNPFKWILGVISKKNYEIDDLFYYNEDMLKTSIDNLDCVNRSNIEPKNASFEYLNEAYEIVEEVYGNKIKVDVLQEKVKESILKGRRKINLDENLCYENPKYTKGSNEVIEAQKLLNKYVSTKITYIFGEKTEVLDGSKINEWINVNDNMEVIIDENKVKEYVSSLSGKYNTVGATRNFKSASGKMVEVKGGYYGWKINSVAETKMLIENIKLGAVLEKEPIYTQKALYRDGDDIGDTYVEINITRQHLWFYKEGKLITQGDIVTGDPNKGHSTKLGTYMLNYKQKEATLRGDNYEAKVTYWMPFNGGIGIHDASWRYSFGGNIYKSNGTHGCVNSPSYLAKTIFDNIEAGTPIICYEE